MAVSGFNFVTVQSAKLTAGATSTSVTFTNNGGEINPSFKITNTGAGSAYIAFGGATAVAVASSATPAANCDCIPSGAVEVLSAPPGTLTVAVIQGSATTILEISIGYGQ